MSNLITSKFKIIGTTEGSSDITFTSEETDNYNSKKKTITVEVSSDIDPFIKDIIDRFGFGEGTLNHTVTGNIKFGTNMSLSKNNYFYSYYWYFFNGSGYCMIHASTMITTSSISQDIIDNLGQWEINYID